MPPLYDDLIAALGPALLQAAQAGAAAAGGLAADGQDVGVVRKAR